MALIQKNVPVKLVSKTIEIPADLETEAVEYLKFAKMSPEDFGFLVAESLRFVFSKDKDFAKTRVTKRAKRRTPDATA